MARRGRKLTIEWATEDDAASLRARYRRERRADVRPRLQGLWLVRTGRTTREVAAVVGVEERTVQRWLGWCRAGGLAEVEGRHAHGKSAAPFLTAEQQADLAGEVETGRCRTAAEVRRWVEERWCHFTADTAPGVHGQSAPRVYGESAPGELSRAR